MIRTAALAVAILTLLSATPVAAATDAPDLRTPAEASGFTRTSSHREVLDLLQRLQAASPRVRLLRMATSTKGRVIPLVVVSRDGIASPRGMRMDGRNAVLINANIHAGEVEGKAASLMLIRDLIQAADSPLLERQVLLIVPDFNPDGNDRFGHNRGDEGPELAGTRANGQNLDLNRDFLKLESPEIRGLVRTLREWDPVLFMDLHTTDGSYHREPVTFTTLANPNSDPKLRSYMWRKMFPAVQAALEKRGFDSVPYGNFRDRRHPEKGWANHAFGALYSTNYVGLRNRFTILDENYAHADFRTRVLACHGFLHAVIQYTAAHLGEMRRMVDEADQRTVRSFPDADFVLDYTVVPLLDFTLKSYRFEVTPIPDSDRERYPAWFGGVLVKPTREARDYRLTYYADTRPARTRPLPPAYILDGDLHATADLLRLHGLVVDRLLQPATREVEVFEIQRVTAGPGLYQGYPPVKLEGKYQRHSLELPAGTYWISTAQPLARLLPELLEPDAPHGLLQWGHFNRLIQRQWSSRPGSYPVMRAVAPARGLVLMAPERESPLP